MEQWPSKTPLLTMTKGKKALEDLELAIPNFGSEMALVTLSSNVWVKTS